MPAHTNAAQHVLPGRAFAPPGDVALAQPLALTVYALAFLVPAWPWLSGAVAIPWDAESQFRPQVMFLARAFATGQSPFWTPNVFAGWPQISDPQSLIFSPLHVLLAWLDAAPSALAFDRVTFAYLFLGGLGIILYFRDRGWHPAGALVAALAFAFGGSANSRLQHTIQIVSLCYLALALWPLGRALERGSWRWGAAAGVLGGLLAVDRDHVALLSLYVLAGLVAAHVLAAPRARLRASLKPLAAAGAVAVVIAAVPVTMTALLAARSNRPEIGYALAGHGSLHPADLMMLAFADLFGIDLFRRPADATFVLGALLAIVAGYCVHAWLDGAVAPATPRQRAIEIAIAVVLVALAVALAATVAGAFEALRPVATGVIGAAAAIAALALARACDRRAPFAAATVLATVLALDFAWNDAPHISTGLPPATFAALDPDTSDETVHVIRTLLAADAAPDRRDRVEMVNIAYHWQNLSLAQDFDHVFGHNPLRLRAFYEATHVGDYIALAGQRVFSPLYPSYRSTFADLFGVRLIVTGVPVEVIDKSVRPGDLDLIARTKEAYVYENPRALPRVMEVGDWQAADFNRLDARGWPAAVDPRQTVLLERAPKQVPPGVHRRGGTARILRYVNSEVDVAVNAPDGGLLLLTDVWHPWWRATLDGKPVDILRADAIFRAVALPPGAHEVRFTFEPMAGAAAELARLVGLAR